MEARSVTALRDLSLLLALLAVCALADGDPDLDLPVAHPLDPRPAPAPAPLPPPAQTFSPIAPSRVKAAPVDPLPPPPVPPADDPKDEPAPVFYGEELESPSASVVFVLDVSGSMAQPAFSQESGYNGPRKIDTARRELVKAISMLPDSWRFDVVAYDDVSCLWRPALALADEEHKRDASAWVQSREPYGATGTGPAVALALSLDRSNLYVVLLTDGAPNVPDARPEWHRQVIRDSNAQRARIDVFGIEANTPAMRSFCLGVATDSGGSYVDAR
jgi:hypothetical protein